MKIKSMTATFGRLEGETLTFGEGLNLIHGPNEGGKSTWCAFWKAMLYGIDTRDRDKAGYLADKNHYQPWSGSPMLGELNITWKGQDITIRRGPRGNTPFGSFSATYTGTGEPVPFLTAQNCGETLTGVSREVFERSALIGGGELAVSSTPDLEKRIAAIVSSGQEDVSFSQVEDRLREWMNRRKVNRSVGLIPKLEEELAQVRAQLDRMSELSDRIARLEGEYASLNTQAKTWNAELERHKQLSRRELDARFSQAQAELDQAQQQLRRLEQDSCRYGAIPDKERLKRAQGELQYLKVLDEEIQAAQAAFTQAEEVYVQAQRSVQGSPFAGMTPEEASERAQDDLAQYWDCVDAAHGKALWTKLFPILGAALSCLWLAVRALFSGLGLMDAVAVVGAMAAGGLLGLLCHRRAASWQDEAEQLLSRWGADSPEDLEQEMEDYRRRCKKTEQAAAELKTIRGALNEKLARKENDITDLMSFVHTFAPEVTALFGCSAALSRALGLDFELNAARDRVRQAALRRDDLAAQGAQLPDDSTLVVPPHTRTQCEEALEALVQKAQGVKADLDQARGALSSLGDPAAAASQAEALSDELERREGEYAALELALSDLREAYSQLQTRFSPELNQLAGEYMGRLTGHRYASLTLDRRLEGQAARTGDVLPHSALYLSRGTVDQLYLSVRLAVCSLCLPQRPPIILDDALVAFDDHRLKLALELLLDLSREQQLLIFTCQNREGQALDGAPITRLELG